MKCGYGEYVYELEQGWGELSPDWELGEVPGVLVDSADNVYF